MPFGPGKYDDVCTMVMEKTRAQGAIVMVFDGALGSGFSVQATAEVTANLSSMLRRMADDIDKSMPEFME